MSSYLGQNFLRDQGVLRLISRVVTDACNAHPHVQDLIEVGPGKGALTTYLCQISDFLGKTVTVYEKDTTFEPILAQIGVKNIVRGDALETFVQPSNPYLMAANLPYYITSPLLSLFAAPWITGDLNPPTLQWGVYMIQREVGEKIKTIATKKSYLRRLLNYRYDIRYIKTVRPSSFRPAPKVDSCLVVLCRKEECPSIDGGCLLSVLDAISRYKRKTIGRSLKMALSHIHKASDTTAVIIDDRLVLHTGLAAKRLEECSWDDMQLIVEMMQTVGFIDSRSSD